MDDATAAWNRIRQWYKKHTPRGTFRVTKGASDAGLDRLESVLGLSLPRTFRACYRIHAGTAGTSLMHFGNLLSLAGIEKRWKMLKKWQLEMGYGAENAVDWKTGQLQSDKIRPVWWNPSRIPISENGGGDGMILDLDPAKGGTKGQVFWLNHEVGPTDLLASGLVEFLTQGADDLEAGKYLWDEEGLWVRPVEWPE